MSAADRVGFYTVGDDRVFPGVVGLLNSVRATGHDDEFVLLDAGFTPSQRAALEAKCTVVDRPRAAATHPTLYKPFPHLLGAEGTIVILETDALVTASFAPLVAAAREGRICTFPDPARGRFFPEWAEMFGVRAPLRRGTYVSAGYFVFSTAHWPDLLPRWWEACERCFGSALVWDKHGRKGRPSPDDQEALNALLMSEVPEGALELLPRGEIVHGMENMAVRFRDRRKLACERDGHSVRYLHAGGTPKPWHPDARRSFRPDAYLRALRWLLHSDGVPLRCPPDEQLPAWLRDGARGTLRFYAQGLRNVVGRREFWIETARKVLPRRLYGALRRRSSRVRRREPATAA